MASKSVRHTFHAFFSGEIKTWFTTWKKLSPTSYPNSLKKEEIFIITSIVDQIDNTKSVKVTSLSLQTCAFRTRVWMEGPAIHEAAITTVNVRMDSQGLTVIYQIDMVSYPSVLLWMFLWIHRNPLSWVEPTKWDHGSFRLIWPQLKIKSSQFCFYSLLVTEWMIWFFSTFISRAWMWKQ